MLINLKPLCAISYEILDFLENSINSETGHSDVRRVLIEVAFMEIQGDSQ